MKKTIYILLALGMFLTPQVEASEESTKKGEITLREYDFGVSDKDDAQVITLGKIVEFRVNRYISDFLGTPRINANAKLINHSDEWMAVTYLIVFYDSKDQVVGSYATSLTLKPNADIHFGSALIKGKKEDFKRVSKYFLYTCSYKTVPKK